MMRALLGNSDEALLGVMQYCTDKTLDNVCSVDKDSLTGVMWTILVDGRLPAQAQNLVLDVQFLGALATWSGFLPKVCFPPRYTSLIRPASRVAPSTLCTICTHP